MNKITQWTTPTLKVNIPEITFDYLIFTISGKHGKINKIVQASETENNSFRVKYTQEETSKFDADEEVEVQINFMADGGATRAGTITQKMIVAKNLLDEVIQ